MNTDKVFIFLASGNRRLQSSLEMKPTICVKLLKRGYGLVFTPAIAKRELWQTSGHEQNYADGLFEPIRNACEICEDTESETDELSFSYRHLQNRQTKLSWITASLCRTWKQFIVRNYRERFTADGMRGTQDDAMFWSSRPSRRQKLEIALILLAVFRIWFQKFQSRTFRFVEWISDWEKCRTCFG